jgi:hypothetical protein
MKCSADPYSVRRKQLHRPTCTRLVKRVRLYVHGAGTFVRLDPLVLCFCVRRRHGWRRQVLLLAEIAHDVDEFNRFKDEEAIAPKIDIRAPGRVPVKRRTKSPTKPAAPLLRRSLSTRSVTRVDVPPHTAVQPIKPPAVVASAATKPMRPPSAKTAVSAPAVNGAGRPQSAKSPARAADRSGAASRPQSAGSPVRAPAKPRPSTAPPKRTTGAS